MKSYCENITKPATSFSFHDPFFIFRGTDSDYAECLKLLFDDKKQGKWQEVACTAIHQGGGGGKTFLGGKKRKETLLNFNFKMVFGKFINRFWSSVSIWDSGCVSEIHKIIPGIFFHNPFHDSQSPKSRIKYANIFIYLYISIFLLLSIYFKVSVCLSMYLSIYLFTTGSPLEASRGTWSKGFFSWIIINILLLLVK